MGEPSPLEFVPGIVKVDAPYALRGRYIDCDKVRFVKGRPEKWKGWEVFGNAIDGPPRALRAWDDFASNRWLAAGSYKGLWVLSTSGTATRITPYRATGTLGSNPIATTSGSAEVVVTHANHGLRLGSRIELSGATAVGGITLNSTYVVTSTINSSSYKVTHTSAASSTATGGGASVLFKYEINPGYADTINGRGWGVGAWGAGTWGTPRATSSFTIYPSMWSLDNYGENLLALLNGNQPCEWDPDSPTARAATVANSPTGNFIFVTNERYPVVLGADGDAMALAWPDQNDITNWTPSSTSTANVRRVQKGSLLVAGANLMQGANILWTDEAVYSMNYTGQRNFVYSTLLAGEKCGLIGPRAFVVAGGRAFWMGSFDFFMFGGSVQPIPNSQDIRDWLYARIDPRQSWKTSAHYSSEHNEIRWNYVALTELEPKYYVAVSLDDFSWTVGTLNRTAWAEKSGINPQTFASDETGIIYQHDVGYNDNGSAMSWHLESAPIDINDGAATFDIWGYIPNFQRQVGSIELTLKTWDLPQETTILDQSTDTIAVGAGIIDTHVSGRQASVRLAGWSIDGDFRLGVQRIEASPAGGRRGGR